MSYPHHSSATEQQAGEFYGTEQHGTEQYATGSYQTGSYPAASYAQELYGSDVHPTRSSAVRAQAQPTSEVVTEGLLRRGLGAAGLVGVALIHVLDLPGKLSETPYLGVAYIGLIVGAVVLAEALLRRDGVRTWLAAGALAGSTLLGYTVNRTVGMPGATDDIGNWLEPLGLASLFVEGVVVALAVTAVLRAADVRRR